MPTLQQNLNVLRNGIQRRGTRSIPADLSSDRILPIRDHYERWAHYYKRQYPKRRQNPWTDSEVLEQAVSAARDTPMGTIDTITREYITYWMPEIMLFVITMDDEEGSDDQTHLETYKSLVEQVRRNVLDVLDRIDCGQDQAAHTLATILKEKTEDRLSKLFVIFEEQLTDEEKLEYNPQQAETPVSKFRESRTPTKTAQQPIPEARILDSSLAWGLTEVRTQPKPPPLKKRRYSQIRSSPGPDPADNGQVWDSPKLDFKRQKFDFTFTSTVKYPQTNQYTVLPLHTLGGRRAQERHTVDLTEDGDDDENTSDRIMVRARDDFPATSESSNLQEKGGQCILM